MYAAYFIRVYSGEKVADCINFWNPSTDTVFQSFRHAFSGFFFLSEISVHDVCILTLPSLSARIILIYFRHFANNMPISTLKTGGLDLKKIKRILAILGAIILAGLYISTIVCALSSNENYMDMLMASVYATVIIPVLIWAYSFVYKMVKKNHEQKED